MTVVLFIVEDHPRNLKLERDLLAQCAICARADGRCSRA